MRKKRKKHYYNKKRKQKPSKVILNKVSIQTPEETIPEYFKRDKSMMKISIVLKQWDKNNEQKFVYLPLAIKDIIHLGKDFIGIAKAMLSHYTSEEVDEALDESFPNSQNDEIITFLRHKNHIADFETFYM